MVKNLLTFILFVGLWGSLHAQYVTTPVNADTRTLNTGYQVGSIPGSLTASANGSSNYQVPIQVPPGVNGLVPSLSVNYNSGSSNGLLGYGVNLTGISFISRGANSFIQDGNSKKVDYNTSDALYLGGSRLILVSGTYGAANSEYRLDNSNKVRVILYGSTTSIYFKLWMPNGRIYLYGNDSNSRLSGSSGILRWYVKSVSDYDGNIINYLYTNDTAGFRIDQITYAGNTVVFEYASRDDKITKCFAGVELKQHKILSKIKVNGQGSRFREYQFSYYKDIYSYLNEIKILGTDGTQVNSTVLNWGNSCDFTINSTSIQKKTNYTRHYGDFNGDGRSDYIEYPDKTSYTSSDKYNIYLTNSDGIGETNILSGNLYSLFDGIQIVDINGDKKDDLFFSTGGEEYSYYYLGYKDGSMQEISGSGSGLSPLPVTYIHGDFNADQNMDLLILERNISGALKITKSIGLEIPSAPWMGTPASITSQHFNSNGSEDLFVVDDNYLRVWEYDSQTKSVKLICSFKGVSDDCEFKDFNGDGIDDIIDTKLKHIYFGTGTGFQQVAYPVVWEEYGTLEKYRKLLFGDFNGDGFQDIYQIQIIDNQFFDLHDNRSIAKIHYNTGDLGFITKDAGKLSPVVNGEDTMTPILSLRNLKVEDINGDNTDDIIYTHNQSSTFQKLLSNDNGNDYHVIKIADGMNNKYAITYQRTNDGNIYSQDASTGDANLSYYQGKNKMVKGISMTSDGVTVSNTTYKYKNQTVHKNYGFLGCKEYTQSESVQNAESTSNFEFLGAYYVGALKSTSSKLSGSLVSSASFTNNVAKVNGSKGFRLISYLSAQSQTDHLRGITNTVAYSGFDSYYNPISISKNLGGALSETQSITYNNLVNSTYWLPGRLSSVTTTQNHTDNVAISTTNKWAYSNHQLSSKIQFYGTPKAVTETYAYSSGKLSSVTVSGSGVTSRTTSFAYDATKRFVTQETNPLGHVTKVAYDPVTGNQLTVTDANNRVTSFTYNGFGQALKTNYPDGTSNTNTISWNSSIAGCVYKASSTLTGNAPSSSYFDRLGRVVRSEGKGYNSKTIKTDTRYDSKGRVAAISLPFSSTKTAEKTFAYDTYGRPSATTLPNGRGSVTYTYNGLTTKVTNPESWKETTIDGAGFVKSAKDPGGQITYNYYSNGLVKDIKFGQNTIHHVYDQQGNAIQTTDPDAGTTSAVYDAFGQITSSTTANNHTYTYAYDKLGRITTRTLQSGGETTQWQYDPSGNIGAINQILLNSKVVESATYDGYGRTSTHTEKIYDGGVTKTYTNSYAYNSNGQVSRITYPTGYYVNHTYNGDGLVTEIRDKNNKLIWNQAVTNDMGQFTSYAYGNGAVVTKTYDSWYQPDIISAKVGSRVLSNWDFDINVKGNLTRRKDILHGNQIEDFAFDALNRLTTSSKGSDVTYTGDNTGNLLTKSDVGTYEYSHSVKKHAVTSIQNPSSSYQPSVESVTYTAFNKVNDIEQTLNGIAKKIEFSYGAGHARKLSRLFESGTKKETNYYTGSNYEVNKNQSSGVEKHYHYISAPSGLAAVFISSGSTTGDLYFVHTDYLGSVVGLSNQSGYIAEEYAYDAWGNRRSPGNWALTDNRTDFLINRGYTMHEHMNGFGLINMNGRVYDPKVGRFLSPDPVLQDAGNTQNMNRYSYAWNNPLKYTDPSGYTSSSSASTSDYFDDSYANSLVSGMNSGSGIGARMSWNLGTIYSSNGSIIQLGTTSMGIRALYDRWESSGYKAVGVPFDKFRNLTSEDGAPIQMSMYTATTENGKTVLTHFMYDYEVPTVKVAFSGDGLNLGYQYGMPDMVNLKNKPVTSIVDWFAFITRHNGINPLTNEMFSVKDIILSKTLPKKNILQQAWGSLANDNVKGTSKFGGDLVTWNIYDSNFTSLPDNANTISEIRADNPYEGFYRIRAMHNGETRISINIYNYELYKTFYNRIYP